jgi:hypothetical protein
MFNFLNYRNEDATIPTDLKYPCFFRQYSGSEYVCVISQKESLSIRVGDMMMIGYSNSMNPLSINEIINNFNPCPMEEFMNAYACAKDVLFKIDFVESFLMGQAISSPN